MAKSPTIQVAYRSNAKESLTQPKCAFNSQKIKNPFIHFHCLSSAFASKSKVKTEKIKNNKIERCSDIKGYIKKSSLRMVFLYHTIKLSFNHVKLSNI